LETKEWVLQRQLLETAVSLIRTFGKRSDANQKVHPKATATYGVTGEPATGLVLPRMILRLCVTFWRHPVNWYSSREDLWDFKYPKVWTSIEPEPTDYFPKVYWMHPSFSWLAQSIFTTLVEFHRGFLRWEYTEIHQFMGKLVILHAFYLKHFKFLALVVMNHSRGRSVVRDMRKISRQIKSKGYSPVSGAMN